MYRSILKTVVFAVSCALLGNAVFAQAKKPLVVYFSVPEDVQTKGTEDAVSGASVVVRGGVKYGNTEFVAKTIQKETGADIFRIETVQDYPKSHNALLNAAQQEERKGTRKGLLPISAVMTPLSCAIRFGGIPCRCLCIRSSTATI